MNPRTFGIALLSLIYAAAYHYAYVFFLFPVFGYLEYRYENPDVISLIWTYFLCVFPVLFCKRSNEPSSLGVVLFYVFGYVSIELTILFMFSVQTFEIVLAQFVMSLSMVTLFMSAGKDRIELKIVTYYKDDNVFFERNRLTNVMYAITIFGVFMTLVEYLPIMQLVSFEDVYEQREIASDVRVSLLTNYLVMWLTYCCGPFFLSRALNRGRTLDWIIGLFISILVYAALGSKLALLTPFLILGLHILYRYSSDILPILLIVMSILVISLTLLNNEEGLMFWMSSILLLRTIGNSGWSAATYFDYFSKNEYTNYTHITPINAVLQSYPYGNMSLGQVIGGAYLNNESVNVNAGFWSSDGFAAHGIVGVLIVTLILYILLKAFNEIAYNFPQKFLNYWLMGFWMAMLNVPLTVALLSCGGLLVVFLLILVSPNRKF